MKTYLIGTLLLASSLGATAAGAAESLPPVKTGAGNSVPHCASPSRLMAFLYARNPKLDQRYAGMAGHYQRIGDELGVRWDYAFFQMIVETGGLSFQRGDGRPGAVSPRQNNFAGLGATGGSEPGESFPDIVTGVKAHLEHLLVYSGERVETPVAERTRKVQEWGILTSWQKSVKLPVRFDDVTRRWATDPAYTTNVGAVAGRFYETCAGASEARRDASTPVRPKPAPLQAMAAPTPVAQAASPVVVYQPSAGVEPALDGEQERVSGLELAREAMARARAEGSGPRSGLGYAPVPAEIVPAPAMPAEPLPYEFTDARPRMPEASTDTGPAFGTSPRPEARAAQPRIVVVSVKPAAPLVANSAIKPRAHATAGEQEPAHDWAAQVEAAPPIAPKAAPPAKPPVVVASATPPPTVVRPTAPPQNQPKPAALAAPAQQPKATPVAAAPPPKPANPIDESIRNLISGKTFIIDGPMGVTIPIAVSDNGTMRGTATGLAATMLGSSTDSGKWWVQRGRLCLRFNTWIDKDTQCMQLRQAGSTIHWVRDDGKTGTARLASR